MAVISRSTSVRLLVIRLSAMGDVAMVAPVLVALRRNYPNLRITVLTPKFLQPFFREVGNIEFFAPDLKGRHKGVACCDWGAIWAVSIWLPICTTCCAARGCAV